MHEVILGTICVLMLLGGLIGIIIFWIKESYINPKKEKEEKQERINKYATDDHFKIQEIIRTLEKLGLSPNDRTPIEAKFIKEILDNVSIQELMQIAYTYKMKRHQEDLEWYNKEYGKKTGG